MTYSQSLDIARSLASADTKAARLLRAMVKSTGRKETFIIMRYGDPREWDDLPTKRDTRTKAHTKSVSRPSKMTGVTKGTQTYIKQGKVVTWTRRTKDWRSIVKTRAVSLEHINGRKLSAPSIVIFCERAKLKGNARYHITPVLDGDRPSYKGWYVPGYLSRAIEVRDVYGNLSTVTVRDLLTKHGLKQTSVSRLLSGERRAVMGDRLMLAETKVDTTLAPRAIQTTKVKLTDGKRVFTGRTIGEAARMAGVQPQQGLYATAYGFRDEYNGLSIKEIEIERKSVLKT